MNKFLIKFSMQATKYFLFALIGICFINENIYAAKLNCASSELVILKDGSSICLDDILAKNSKDKSNSSKIIEGVKTDSKYAIAKSATHECNSFGYANASPFVINALSDCKKNGCDCEVVIASGVSLVSKQSLFGEDEKSKLAQSKDLTVKDKKESITPRPLSEGKSKEAEDKSADKSKPEEQKSENSPNATEDHAESDSNDASKKSTSLANHSPMQAALYIPLFLIVLIILGLSIYWRKLKNNNKPGSSKVTEASE
jgi:hypothetical protein